MSAVSTKLILDRKKDEMRKDQNWKVTVSEIESGEIHSVVETNIKGATSIFVAYQNDDFYKVETQFLGYIDLD